MKKKTTGTVRFFKDVDVKTIINPGNSNQNFNEFDKSQVFFLTCIVFVYDPVSDIYYALSSRDVEHKTLSFPFPVRLPPSFDISVGITSGLLFTFSNVLFVVTRELPSFPSLLPPTFTLTFTFGIPHRWKVEGRRKTQILSSLA